MKENRLFVISGPSGIGIADIIAAVFESRDDVSAVLPVTARKMKAGETDGVGFKFYDLDGWNSLKESGDLLETTEFAGNDYGTSRSLVKEKLAEGKSVIINLEAARAAQVKKNMPEAVWVEMRTSSPAILEAKYAETARHPVETMVRMEMAQAQEKLSEPADYRICCDEIPAAVTALNALLDKLTQ